MQTPNISKLTFQDTPAAVILLEWWDGDTFHAAHVPTAWANKIVFGDPVTDAHVSNKTRRDMIVNDIQLYFTQWVASIRLDFPENISTLECAAEFIPEQFQTRAA